MKPKRQHDRGAYRSIFTVLLDGKDFRALDRDARWTFVALKLTLGPYQIGVLDAPEHVLSAKTGCTLATVRRALVLLDDRAWIAREANVLWVIEGLKYEPSINANDPKHRTGVQNFAATLPRLPIVDRFRLHYRDYFPEALARPIEGPSEALGSREDRRQRRETETETETEEGDRRTVGIGEGARDARLPENCHDAYDALAGISRNAPAWHATVTAHLDGLNEPSATPAVMALALSDMYLAGAVPTGNVLRGFLRKAAAPVVTGTNGQPLTESQKFLQGITT